MRTLLLLVAALPSASDAFSAPSAGPFKSKRALLGPSVDPYSASRSRGNAATMDPATNHSTAVLPYVDGQVEELAADLPRMTDPDIEGLMAAGSVPDLDLGGGGGEPQCVEAGIVEYCPVDNAPRRSRGIVEDVLSTYAGPRVLLALAAVLYGTNFPLGAIMNDNLPASAATSGRMALASIVLAPFLLQLKPSVRTQAFVGGAFVSMGYISQSLALVDTSPSLVSFLGALTVIVCPVLQWAVDKKPMSMKEAPQTWLAAFLCMSGVAALELFGPSDVSSSFSLAESVSRLGVGDALSLLQAVGFGIGIYMSEKMMKQEPDQALPITAGMITTTAFFAMLWCFADGWMREPGWESIGLPGLFLNAEMRPVAVAVAFTGIVSTSTNFCIEITALGRVPSAEASVILATEPLWASVFAALWFNEQFGANDYIGGALMISACLVNTLAPSDITGLFSKSKLPEKGL